jgi:hypothetical protein
MTVLVVESTHLPDFARRQVLKNFSEHARSLSVWHTFDVYAQHRTIFCNVHTYTQECAPAGAMLGIILLSVAAPAAAARTSTWATCTAQGREDLTPVLAGGEQASAVGSAPTF